MTGSVDVWFKNNGTAVSLTYKMERTPAGWRIADIHYPSGPTLRALVVGRNAGHALNYQLVSAIQKAVAADRRRSVARVIRSTAPVPVASTGDGFLPGVAAL